MIARPEFREILRRAALQRCPNCGRGKIFRHWFSMFRSCPVCGLSFFREEGYYVGAMFLNFIIAALLIIAIYLVLLLLPFPSLTDISTNRQVMLWILFGIVLCLGLVRSSYSLWLAVDFWISPWPPGVVSEYEKDSSGLPPIGPRLR